MQEDAGADQDGVMSMRKKAEIDTSAPFRSVQEAVLLFGERILGGQVYANKLREIHDGISDSGRYSTSRFGVITAELEETKQSLQKARDESLLMASCLSSLQEELQKTKKELQYLKESESSETQMMDYLEIEDVKFVEDSTEEEFQVKKETICSEPKNVEFQKKRYVTFAEPPCLAQVVVPPTDAVLQRHPSLRKSKKKPLIPLIKGFFRKRGSSGIGPAGA